MYLIHRYLFHYRAFVATILLLSHMISVLVAWHGVALTAHIFLESVIVIQYSNSIFYIEFPVATAVYTSILHFTAANSRINIVRTPTLPIFRPEPAPSLRGSSADVCPSAVYVCPLCTSRTSVRCVRPAHRSAMYVPHVGPPCTSTRQSAVYVCTLVPCTSRPPFTSTRRSTVYVPPTMYIPHVGPPCTTRPPCTSPCQSTGRSTTYVHTCRSTTYVPPPCTSRTLVCCVHTFTIRLSTFQPRCSAIFKLCPNFEMLSYMCSISEVVSTQNIV